MKNMMYALAALVLVTGTAFAEADKAAQEGTQPVPLMARKVAMVNAANLDEDVMERVVDYVEKNMRIGVREMSPLKPAGMATLDEEADILKNYMPSKAYSMVALVKMGEEEKRHGVIHPHDQIAVLNTAPLELTAENGETFARRLEKESVRCVALLAGLSPCVNPRCALWHYADDAGLDKKGANLCPPCFLKYQALDLGGPPPSEAK